MISLENSTPTESTLALVSQNETSIILPNSSSNITIRTELRHLPIYVKAKLGQLMEDRDKHWQEIMTAIPQSPPWFPGMDLPSEHQPYLKKYTAQDCRTIENHVRTCYLNTSIGNGINVLLEEWGCSGKIRPMLGDFLNLLQRYKLYAVISYLKQDVLNEYSTEDATDEFSALDSLLVEENSTEQHVANYSSDDSILKNLLEEHRSENEIITAESFQKIEGKEPPVFDQTVVPHISYGVLAAASGNFSNKPYSEGGKKLGEGAFGVVFKANVPMSALNIGSHNDEVRELAIKKLSFNDDRTDKQFKLEIEVLSQCKHENILELEGYSCDGPSWCLMYSFMSNGNLQDRLAGTCDAPPTCQQRLVIIQGTANGIAYLHTFMKTPMIHRDIKSANILLDSNLMPKICDFGLVRIGGKGMHTKTMEKTNAVFGTSAYMAPEAFRGDVSVKLDTFSYGVVLLEILTGLPIFDEDREGSDLLSHIQGLVEEELEDLKVELEDLKDTRADPWPPGLPKAISDLSKKCVEEKKQLRPTVVEVAEICEEIIKKWRL